MNKGLIFKDELTELYNMKFQDFKFDDSKNYIVITDPPYNIGFKYDVYKDNLKIDEYIKLIKSLKDISEDIIIIHYPEETMKYFVPALGVPNDIIVWCYNSNLPSRHSRLINFYGFKPDLNKVKFPYQNPTDKRIKERIANGSKGRRSYDWFNDVNLRKNVTKDKEGNIHTCPLPDKLIDRIIDYIPDNLKDYIIVDPFTGSGTTLKIARLKGIKSIGFEISKDYCRVAKKLIIGGYNNES